MTLVQLWTLIRKRLLDSGVTLFLYLCLCQCQNAHQRPISVATDDHPGGKFQAKHALTLIASHDTTGSFSDLESTLEQTFSKWPCFENHCRSVSSLEAFREAIEQSAMARGPLDALILAFHGQANKFRLSSTENFHQRNLNVSCAGLDTFLHADATVILYACATGEGDDNLARDLAKVLKRPIIAPVYYWLMQTAVPLPNRVPELTLDPKGHLTVATDRFALYYKARLESGRDRHLIAPKAMEALCREDGFYRKASRFRPLFQRYLP